jgi:hypothetical protein
VKLALVEVALDFRGPMIDRHFVRSRGLFGRSGRTQSKNRTDYWGARKGTKRVKSYDKSEIDVHRVELELRSRFLRRHHIEDPFDFPKLLQLLPGKNISFARLDEAKLRKYLRRRGLSEKKIANASGFVDPSECNTEAALAYLREELGLTNARRFLKPLEGTNLQVRKALKKWAKRWERPGNLDTRGRTGWHE